ncbi:MAG TPA: hypothetical protein VJB89_00325 [Candidatus Nanoarchaeia archaeon]|nr:hypothetical protein [Candidatus Nanoarchaeia archaeon]
MKNYKPKELQTYYLIVVCLTFLISVIILVNEYNTSLVTTENLGFILYFNEFPKEKNNQILVNFTIENYIEENAEFDYYIYVDNKILVEKTVVLGLKKNIFTQPINLIEDLETVTYFKTLKIKVKKGESVKEIYYFN